MEKGRLPNPVFFHLPHPHCLTCRNVFYIFLIFTLLPDKQFQGKQNFYPDRDLNMEPQAPTKLSPYSTC